MHFPHFCAIITYGVIVFHQLNYTTKQSQSHCFCSNFGSAFFRNFCYSPLYAELAESVNESISQIKRYIRLTHLVPELLQFVDEGKIAMRPAVEMSYLDEETQRMIVDRIDDSGGEVFPSHAQTRRIRQQAENGGITYDDITAIMDEQKPNQAPTFKVSEDMIFEITKRRFTPQEFDEYLKKALECYARELKRQRDRDAR